MWSDLDKQIAAFIKTLETQLSKDADLKDDLPLDNLQVSISLEQQSNPPIIAWNVTVRQGPQKIFNIGCTTETEASK